MTFIPEEINKKTFGLVSQRDLLMLKRVCKQYKKTADELEKVLLQAKLTKIKLSVLSNLNSEEKSDLISFINKFNSTQTEPINKLRKELNSLLQKWLTLNVVDYYTKFGQISLQILGRSARQGDSQNLSSAVSSSPEDNNKDKNLTKINNTIITILDLGVKFDEIKYVEVMQDFMQNAREGCQIKNLLETHGITPSPEKKEEENPLAINYKTFFKGEPKSKCNIM